MSLSKVMYEYFSMAYQLTDIVTLNTRVSAIMYTSMEIWPYEINTNDGIMKPIFYFYDFFS